jgi:hypothetical protein
MTNPNLIVNAIIVLLCFIAALGVGLIGLGLFRLLPKRIREKIENYHNE